MDTVTIGPALRPLRGVCRVPGDKSIAHRALFLGAVADGLTRIRHVAPGADNRSTMAVLRELGVPVREGLGEIRIAGGGWEALRPPERILDCGNSGTTMRLGVGLLAGRPFDSMLAGDASLCRRPMARVMAPLALMGALIESRGTSGRPPLAVRGQPLRGIVYELPVPSAQVKSAILLAGLQAEGETVVIESAPTRDHTERLLPEFGVPVRVELVRSDVDSVLGRRIAVNRAALRGTSITVPGDLSAAAFFIVAAALVDGSEIVIPDVGINPTRCGILTVLERMGAKITVDPQPIGSGPEPVGTLVVSGGALRGIEVDPALVPSLIDEVPILCVAAACASGETRITGAAELRVKESDRIAAMTTELRALGVQVEELADGLVIEGKGRAGIDRQLRGGRRSSHGDHRIAMALGVAGLMADGGVAIDDAAVADVSFPGFYDQLRALMEG